MDATLSVTRSLFIRAAREKVWAALTDPAKIAVWLTEFRFTGPVEAGAQFVMPDGEDNPPGVVVTVEPPQRFAFRWTAEKGHAAMTLVTLTLDAVSGGTQVTVTESGFEALDAEIRKAPFERNSNGWGFALAGLAKIAEEVQHDENGNG